MKFVQVAKNMLMLVGFLLYFKKLELYSGLVQHWASMLLGWETARELQVLRTKANAGLCCRSM